MPAGLLKMTPMMCSVITKYARPTTVVRYEQSTQEAINISHIADGIAWHVITYGNDSKYLW